MRPSLVSFFQLFSVVLLWRKPWKNFQTKFHGMWVWAKWRTLLFHRNPELSDYDSESSSSSPGQNLRLKFREAVSHPVIHRCWEKEGKGYLIWFCSSSQRLLVKASDLLVSFSSFSWPSGCGNSRVPLAMWLSQQVSSYQSKNLTAFRKYIFSRTLQKHVLFVHVIKKKKVC